MKPRNSLIAFIAGVAAFAHPAVAFEYNDGKVVWNYVPVEGATNEVCLGDGTNACVSASVEGAITLPDTIGGKRVTMVAANAFKDCTKVTSVSILGNLERIEEGAFDGATSLKAFGTLNRNENFFSYQGSLYTEDWEGAELVRVPPALEVEEFTGLVKPQVWYVYPGAFNGCANIQRIQVDETSAEALYECSFVGCTSFTEFVWAGDYWDDWSEYCVRDGVLYCGDYECDGECELIKWPTAKPLESFESMMLSENSDFSVAGGAFAGNPMEKITIPAWTWVGSYAFAGCANLREIAFLGYADWSCGVLYDMEDAGINLKKVIYPGFPKGMAEDWEGLFDYLKEEYGGIYSNIVYEKTADPNLGKTNITIPYTERWELCWKYDFEAYAKDLTTLTFEGPCPDDFMEILDICSNVTTVVYSANPLYRDYDVDWMSWKSVISEFEGVPGAPEFVEGSVPAEPQWVFGDCSLYACEVGWDDGKDMPIFLPCVWPLPANGELVIPDRIGGSPVLEISWSAFYGAGTEEIRSLTLPRNVECIDEEAIDALAGWSSLAEIKMSDPMQTPEMRPFQWQSTDSEPLPFEQHAYAVIDGALCGGDYAILRVPPAYSGKVRIYSQGYPVLRDEGWGVYWNALSNCRYVDTIEIDDLEVLECLVGGDIDLSGCDSLTAFKLTDQYWGCEDDPVVVDGALYEEDYDGGCLRLLLWPNAKRPIEFARGTVEVDCDAFRYVKDPAAITEVTVPSGCWIDFWCLAEDYGFTGIAKLVFEGEADISSDIVEALPGLEEIVYSPSPFYAENWEWIKEDFEGTGVKFTAAEPSEPLYGYELDVWDEDDEGNILSGECYLGYNGYPFVCPALKGAYEIPEKIENCRVVWAYENAFANMGELTELAFPQAFRGFDAGSYRDGYYDTNTWAWVTTGEVDIVYSPFVGCASLKKLTFNCTCPEGLWEVLEVTPSIREVYYNDSPWYGESGWIWSEFIAEFTAEYPDSDVIFVKLPEPAEPIWDVRDGELWGVWPDLVGEVTVPDKGIWVVVENAFAGMTNLTALTFPSSLKDLGAGIARYRIDKVSGERISLDPPVTNNPFAGCSSLEKLTFNGLCPNALEEALDLTPSIREVYYNDTPWEDDEGGGGCPWNVFISEYKLNHPGTKVKFLELPRPSEPIWNIEDGELYGEYEPETGWRMPCVWPDLVGEETVPDGVYYIGENAFACMSNLTALTIPASVENFDAGTYREGYWDYDKSEWVVTGEVDIVYSPFVGCTSLKKLVFQGGMPPEGVWELLELTPSIEEVVVPSWKFLGEPCEEGVYNEWLTWFVGDYKAEHPDSTIVFKKDDGTVIGGWEEYVPWKVEGDTMTVDWWAELDEGVFDGVDLSAVTRLVLPPYLDYVEDGVFGALTNLCEVEAIFTSYGDEATYFGSMFGEGQRLKLTIKPEIWWECDCEYCETASIDDVFCPICKAEEAGDCDENCGCPGHWEIEDFAIQPEQFENAEWIETLVIEEPAFAIADYAFAGCVNLKEAEIPASVEWMGEGVFADCEKLEKVSYGGNAPYGCAWLYDGASSNLVSYVKYGTTGWTGLDGEAGLPFPALWPVWEEDDATARPVAYGTITETGYAIVFLPNGGSGEMTYQVCARDKVYNLTKCAFRKTGKTFRGWAGSNGRRYDDGVLVFNAAEEGATLTLTAIWE